MSSQKNEEWVSLREFARRCGRRHRAAQKAIEDRRIPAAAVRRDERGHVVAIEYYQASACWYANTDPAHTRPAIRVPARPPVQTSARDQMLDRMAYVLGGAFANALLPACAMAVQRRGLTPALALDVYEDLLLVVMFTVADCLQLDPEDDRPKVLFRDELGDVLDPERRGALLERIHATAVQLADEDRDARAAGAVKS